MNGVGGANGVEHSISSLENSCSSQETHDMEGHQRSGSLREKRRAEEDGVRELPKIMTSELERKRERERERERESESEREREKWVDIDLSLINTIFKM